MFQLSIIRYHSIPKKVRMRVVRNTGSTADVVGLGEDLQLRIEIDQDSAFGLFARTLEARCVSNKINWSMNSKSDRTYTSYSTT